MKKLSVAILALTTLYGSFSIAADIAKEGHFTWSSRKNDQYEIKGTFTQTAADTYDVVFNFRWGKGAKAKDHTYTGTLTGSLDNGTIEGTCSNENGKRAWNVRGEVENGVISCKHYEIRKGSESYTGTLDIH